MKRSLVLLAVAALCTLGVSATPVNVGLQLLLAVDVSGSVDANEYNLQKQGYVAAFQNPGIQAQIASITGGVAVSFMEWSGVGEQVQLVPWTVLTDAASANAFAAAINGVTRVYSGLTAPGSAINFGVGLFNAADFNPARKVIDVSGDGAQNDGASTIAAATAAFNAGFRVNGLAILGESGLQLWYQNNIVTPGGGFLEVANDFGDFELAVSRKIGREIAGDVPEPSTYLLLSSGLLLAGLLRRKR